MAFTPDEEIGRGPAHFDVKRFDADFGYTVDGWTTLMGSIWALGGIQLLCLGILGEYIGKIYQETKRRPRFLVEEFLQSGDIPNIEEDAACSKEDQ